MELKALAGGDASYTLPYTEMKSEGTYICSVLVNPLFGSVDINLQIEGEEGAYSVERRGVKVSRSETESMLVIERKIGGGSFNP